LTEANAKVDELKRKLLDAMGSPLKDLADEAANLEVVIVQADLDSLRLSHGSAVEEAACLEADLAGVRAELTSELAEAHAATEALQGELQTASARVESLEQDLKGRESVTELEQKLQNGQVQMDTFKQLVEGKLKDGQVQLAGANARIMQYMGELAVLRKDANNSAETSPGAIAALHRQLSEANAQLSEANASLEVSELAATEYVGELAVLRKAQEGSSGGAELTELRNQLSEANGQLSEAKALADLQLEKLKQAEADSGSMSPAHRRFSFFKQPAPVDAAPAQQLIDGVVWVCKIKQEQNGHSKPYYFNKEDRKAQWEAPTGWSNLLKEDTSSESEMETLVAELYGELDGKQEINEELREANKMLKSQLEQVAGELSECGVGASAVNSLVSQLGAPRAADAGSNDY